MPVAAHSYLTSHYITLSNPLVSTLYSLLSEVDSETYRSSKTLTATKQLWQVIGDYKEQYDISIKQ